MPSCARSSSTTCRQRSTRTTATSPWAGDRFGRPVDAPVPGSSLHVVHAADARLRHDDDRRRAARPAHRALGRHLHDDVTANDLRVWQADSRSPGPPGRAARPDDGRDRSCSMARAPCTWRPTSYRAPACRGFPGDPTTTDSRPRCDFAPGDLVRSVGTGFGTAFYDVDTARAAARATRVRRGWSLLVIVSGPETYTTAGTSTSRIPAARSAGWAPRPKASRCWHPRPRCPPSPDATDLVYLSVLERHMCLRRGDPGAGPGRPPGRPGSIRDQVESDPAWLAAEPAWAVFGEGIDGLDPGLPVVARADAREPPDRGLDHRPRPLRRSRPRRRAGSSTRRSGAMDPCRSTSRRGAARSGSSSPASNRRRDRDAERDPGEVVARWLHHQRRSRRPARGHHVRGRTPSRYSSARTGRGLRRPITAAHGCRPRSPRRRTRGPDPSGLHGFTRASRVSSRL